MSIEEIRVVKGEIRRHGCLSSQDMLDPNGEETLVEYEPKRIWSHH
jgi:hypothetical protein